MNKKLSKSISKVTKKDKDKIPVTFNEDQIRLIEQFKGILGNTKAEIVRNIVINWIINNKK
jgi:hypothetical protein